MDFLLVGLGLVILVFAGDALVRGAVNLSLRLGIPALIVGLTIVAFGTSAPELLVSVNAVIKGLPDIAVGNVVGSNIANVLLVLGIPALLFGMKTSHCDTRQSYVQMIAVTVLLTALIFLGPLSWIFGLPLLGIYVLIMANEVRNARAHRRENHMPELEGADPHMRWWKIAAFLAAGIIGLPIGADMLVGGATAIARSFEISEAVIGLTLVAVGTSLPELATTVVAVYHRKADVALGNVVGSNIANILVVLGSASLFGTIPVSSQILSFDIWVMLAVALLLYPVVFHRVDISRIWGACLTAAYAAYVVVLLA